MPRTLTVFDAGGPAGDMSPIPLRLIGFYRSKPEQWTEDFAAIPEAPAGLILDVGSAERIDPETGKTYYALGPLRDFFNAALYPDDAERFDRLIHDRDRLVGLETIAEMFKWLVAEYAGRPTSPRPTSPDGSRSVEGSSEAGSSTGLVLPPPPL